MLSETTGMNGSLYTCYATVSGEAGKEQTDAGMLVDDSSIDFTIRWCKRRLKLTVPISV